MAIHHNKYELLERIGVGGMAEVFRARMVGHAGFQKVVALKRILEDFSSDQDFLHRFIDEARLTARLQHPNICQVLDFGIINDRYYLTLEYVHGLDLAQVLSRLEYHGELLAPRICLQVIAGVLRGLSHAHRAKDEEGRPLGIVHRDVSPQNVLLSINGDIKLSDFGAAKADSAVRQARTQENIALGKLAYMSPEQRRGKSVDGRTDVYGVGILLAEMLDGPTLFRRNTSLSGIDRERLTETTKERFPATIAPRVAILLKKALETQPVRRFSDALAMLAKVEKCSVELGGHSSTDQLGDLIRRLIEDDDKDAKRPAKVPKPAPVVTTSFASGTSDDFASIEIDVETDDDDDDDETSNESIDDTADDTFNTKGIDSLEKMLDSANVAFAPTQPANRLKTDGQGIEELATQVVKAMSRAPDSDTQIIETPEDSGLESLDTNVVEKPPDGFEEQETKVIKGPMLPPSSHKKAKNFSQVEGVNGDVHDAITDLRTIETSDVNPTLPKLRGKAMRVPTPPPTLPTMPGVALRQETEQKKESSSQPPVTPPPTPLPSPDAAAMLPQPAPNVPPNNEHPSKRPPAQEPSQWNDPSPSGPDDQLPAQRMISSTEEDEPTHVDQAPTPWKNPSKDNSETEEHGAETQENKQGKSRLEETSLVRRAKPKKPKKRHAARYIIIIGLLIAIGIALWSAFTIVGWLAQRDGTPWPFDRIEQSVSPRPEPAPSNPRVVPLGTKNGGVPPIKGPVKQVSPVPPPDGGIRQEIDTPQADASPTDAMAQRHDGGVQRGLISIISNPPGRAYIDGGFISSRTPVRRHMVESGHHRVRVVFSESGETEIRVVHVAPGEHEVIRFIEVR